MGSISQAASARRVGLSLQNSPGHLLKNIQGRETQSPKQPPVKASKIKVPPPVDDSPPSSPSDESRGNPRSEAHNANRDLPHMDSSDSDPGRVGQSSIKTTNFVPGAYMGTSRPSTRGNARGKPQKLNETAVEKTSTPNSSQDKEDGTHASADSSSHLKDEHGFVRKKKITKSQYGSQKSRQTSRQSRPAKTGFQVPEDFTSPEKPKKSLRIPGGDDFLQSPAKKAKLTHLDPLDSSPPAKRKATSGKMKGPRKQDEVKEESPPPRAVFKMPDELPGSDHDRPSTGGIADVSLSDLDSSDDEATTVQAPPPKEDEAVCPWCGDAVDGTSLKDFSKGKRMSVRMQTKFCQIHKRTAARESWRDKGYPEVDWDTLESRFADHDDFLLRIVSGEPSHFRTILGDKIESGKARSLKREDNMNPGYYGPRGFNLMCDYLVGKFANILMEKAVDDPVIAGRGPAAFIQSVLVAELAVQLVMVDMGVPLAEAREIMEESKALGEMVHEDL